MASIIPALSRSRSHATPALPPPLVFFLTIVQFSVSLQATAQGTLADYIRADSFNARTRGLVVNVAESPNWIGDTHRFWYRKSVEGGTASSW